MPLILTRGGENLPTYEVTKIWGSTYQISESPAPQV